MKTEYYTWQETKFDLEMLSMHVRDCIVGAVYHAPKVRWPWRKRQQKSFVDIMMDIVDDFDAITQPEDPTL